MKTSYLVGILTIVGVFSVSGCATKVAPVESISNAEMAIKAAQESNATIHAPAEIKLAEEKLNNAKAAVEKGEFELAKRLAEQALVDAKLAETKSLSQKAKKMAQEMQDSINTLKREIERSQKLKQQ